MVANINSSVRSHSLKNMGGKGQRRRDDTNKTGHVGKKNKTNNNDAVNSMNATTDDADAGTNNAGGLTSVKRWVDADRTKVVVDNTINATTNNRMPTQTNPLGRNPENKGLTHTSILSLLECA